jgi:predicted HTH transcriptional regulator
VTESNESLAARIRLGEDSLLEVKAMAFAGDRVKGPSRDELADELAAFANAHGGIVVLGIDDKTRAIQGIPLQRLDLAVRFVTELCQDAVKPALMPRIERVELPGPDGSPRFVVRIDVEKSLFVHASPGGFFYRVGDSKRQMAPDFLARLMQQRSQARIIRFDETVVPRAELSDLDPVLVDRFRSPLSGEDRTVLLRQLSMADEDEQGKLRPTIAGLLLGSRAPQRWLPTAYIQAVAYRGDSFTGVAEGGTDSLRLYQLDAKDIGGPLDEQVVEACRFVSRNMRVEANKRMGRQDVPQYDLEAVFEAVVNAVAHRDYSMHGSRIRLRLFSNRLEIYSPGGLANSMRLDNLALRQSARNEAICSLLARCPVPKEVPGVETPRSTFMDRRGEGVRIILERSEFLAKKRPTYSLPTDSELVLTISAATALDHWTGP